MRFNFTRISIFLLSSVVLADSSLIQYLSQLEKRANAPPSDVAGAILPRENAPPYYNISGTFEIPRIRGPTNSAVDISVGFDGTVGVTCNSAGAVKCGGAKCGSFSVGVGCVITSCGKPNCTAVATWGVGSKHPFTNIRLSPGDNVTLTILATPLHPDQTVGYATVANTRNGTDQIFTQTIEFTYHIPPCQINGQWIVTQIPGHDLAHFDVISFRNPMSFAGDRVFTPANATIFNITEKNGTTMTATYADKDVVAVWHRED